jgi:hypothetical protein
MMDFELKLEKPETKMAWIEGLVMGISYFLGTHKVTTSNLQLEADRAT